MKSIFLGAVLVCASVVPGHGRNALSIAAYTADRCQEALVGSTTHDCDQLTNTMWDDRAVSLTFYDTKSVDEFALSFLTDGSRQVVSAGGKVIEQPVTLITIALHPRDPQRAAVQSWPAVGKCRFGNPTGVAEVSCTGTTAEGRKFSGNFRANAAAPSIRRPGD